MPEGISNFLTPQELQKLGRLVLQSRYVVEGNLSGRHRSPHRGSSSEFADHRSYVEGDDLKRLDWKVLARTDRYFIRRYEDETNLRVYLVIDRSASMNYGNGPKTKYQYACHLAIALGYVIIKARDSVGLFLYSNNIDARMGPRNSFVHLNNMAKTITEQQPDTQTETAKTLHQVAEMIRRRAMIIIFSDLFDESEHVTRAFAHLRKQRHDVILFHIFDPMELDFKFKKGTIFVDMETGERVQADPRSMAKEYRKIMGDFIEKNRKMCSEMNIDYRLVRTDHDIGVLARSYLEERKRFSK